MIKFSVERAHILAAMARAQAIVDRKGMIPILSHVMITARKSGLVLRVTNLDIEATIEVEAVVREEGDLTVPAVMLYEMLRKMPAAGPVDMELNDQDRLLIRGGRAEFDIATLPAEDFPAMGTDSFEVEFVLTAEDFHHVFDKTRFAMSNEEIRYYLNGVFFHIHEEGDRTYIRGVATDGHRLAMAQVPATPGSGAMPDVIVPRKTVLELRKLIDAEKADVHVSVSATKIRMSMNGVTLTSKVIDGKYPDYRRIIPFANARRLSIDGVTLGAIVDRISTVHADRSGAVRMALADDSVTFSTRSSESGLASETAAAGYSADPMEIGINSRYMMEIAQQVGDKTMDLYMNMPQDAILIRENNDPDMLYVVMPMRV